MWKSGKDPLPSSRRAFASTYWARRTFAAFCLTELTFIRACNIVSTRTSAASIRCNWSCIFSKKEGPWVFLFNN